MSKMLCMGIVVALLMPMGASAQELLTPRAEQRCEKDTDCTAVAGVCGGWVPINFNHTEDVILQIQKLKATTDCPTIVRQPFPSLVCDQQRCKGQ